MSPRKSASKALQKPFITCEFAYVGITFRSKWGVYRLLEGQSIVFYHGTCLCYGVSLLPEVRPLLTFTRSSPPHLLGPHPALFCFVLLVWVSLSTCQVSVSILNRTPLAVVSATSTAQPCASAIVRTIARPNPDPEPVPIPYSNSPSRCSGRTPGPSSST